VSGQLERGRNQPHGHQVLAELREHDRRRGRFVAAADEAGRGCLAGPLIGAAVLLDLDHPDLPVLLDGVKDSKKLTAKRRRLLVPRILAAAERVAITIVDAEEMDQSARLGTPALKRFVIVESSELRDLYGVTEVPRAFVFPPTDAIVSA
jgi:ribonuclease HII